MKKFICKMTPEEVAKLLQEGKAIKKLCDDNEYKLVNGLLYDSDNNCLNSQLFLDDEDLYFEIEEETIKEPFEIKECGLYKTRDGRKAFVTSIDNVKLFKVKGVIEGDDRVATWTLDGIYLQSLFSDKDIVSKWEEQNE